MKGQWPHAEGMNKSGIPSRWLASHAFDKSDEASDFDPTAKPPDKVFRLCPKAQRFDALPIKSKRFSRIKRLSEFSLDFRGSKNLPHR